MTISQLTKIVDGSLVPSSEQLAGSLVELSAGAGNAITVETDGLKVDLSTYATSASVDAKIAEAQLGGGEVDLSTYATNESVDAKIAAIPSVDISSKVDKVEGKVLSTNDFTNTDKAKLDEATTSTEVTALVDTYVMEVYNPQFGANLAVALDTKVDKVAGKGLSTEDFTTVHKTAVEGIDANINTKVNTAIASVVNGAPAAFDTLKEISDWIEGDGVNATELAAAVAGKADASALDAKLDTPVTAPLDLNTPTVNSLPMYTLSNSGEYVLCTPDTWLLINGYYIPAYTEDTIVGPGV